MKMQKNSNTPNHSIGLHVLGRAALLSATMDANSACAAISHDPKKPEALKKLRKF